MTHKVECRTPTAGRKSTRIDRWKFEAVRSALLEVVPAEEPGVEFRGLSGKVAKVLEEDQRERLDSVGWYTTTVKLELEVRGELKRLEGSGPQRLIRSAGARATD